MQHTVPYTPQQNGVSERKNRTLKEMANCMLQSKELSLNYWAEAINCANYILNRTPTKALKNITPEKAWSSIKPNVSHFRVFGSEAWAHIPDEKRKALELSCRKRRGRGRFRTETKRKRVSAYRKLLYLNHTHPDLSFAVGLVARFMQNPRESHWKAAKRILRYVRGTLQFGIHYSAKAAPLLVGFTDSDWAGDPDDRKSTAGYVFTLGSGPITWACKKQAAISLSSAEAEYRGAVEASKEALWLRQILSEFGFEQQHPTTLWCDNPSAIQLCKDPVQHQRSKHIELHMHFIRKLIHDHVLEVQYCSTDDQVADIFTKALTEAKFTKLRYMLGVQEVVTKGG
eukprot:PITA_03836